MAVGLLWGASSHYADPGIPLGRGLALTNVSPGFLLVESPSRKNDGIGPMDRSRERLSSARLLEVPGRPYA
jgi:hypothetical protein